MFSISVAPDPFTRGFGTFRVLLGASRVQEGDVERRRISRQQRKTWKVCRDFAALSVVAFWRFARPAAQPTVIRTPWASPSLKTESYGQR